MFQELSSFCQNIFNTHLMCIDHTYLYAVIYLFQDIYEIKFDIYIHFL